jgi:hypothetical protein
MPADQREAPNPCRRPPAPGEPAGRNQLGGLHRGCHDDDRGGGAGEQRYHALDGEKRRDTGESDRRQVREPVDAAHRRVGATRPSPTCHSGGTNGSTALLQLEFSSLTSVAGAASSLISLPFPVFHDGTSRGTAPVPVSAGGTRGASLLATTAIVSPRRLMIPAFRHSRRARLARCLYQPHLLPSSAPDRAVRPPG